MTTVFLSSTSRDLSGYREAVYKAIEGLDGFHCVRMEDFGARNSNISIEEFCRQQIADCELLICLVGLCFGSPAPGSKESYTILEYRAADSARIPRLVFVSASEDESIYYYPGFYHEPDEKWNKQQAFRQEVGNVCIRETFIEPHDLARKVVAAIRNWERGRENRPITQPDYFMQRAPHLGIRDQFFDNTLCLDASLADLDLEKVKEFFSRDLVQRQQDFRPRRSVQDQLIGLELLREAHPTYGALLCFGSNLQAWLPSASIHCFEWLGNTRHEGWNDDQDCRGDLLAQFENSLDFLRKHLRYSRVIKSEERKEQYEIPIETLTEAIANALVHREYARRENNEYAAREGSIQVEVYRDRLEIKSPGLLPPQLTIEALETVDTTHPRNPLIARLFYLYGLVERAGSGIQRMRYALENAGLPPPRFITGEGQTFKVIFERPQQIPEEILESDEFGSLLNQGLEEIAAKENKAFEKVVTDISILTGAENISLIHKWLKGQVPASDQITLLARTCVQTGGLSEIWLRNFLKAAHYLEITSLLTELYSRTILKDLEKPHHNSFTEVPQIWNVPYRRNPFFTGREDLLKQLHEYFTHATAAAITQPPAITGLGGIGKTQVAVEYAYRYKEAYQSILWANAASRETLIESFVAISSVLTLPEKDESDQTIAVAAVQRWLATQSNWLLILDNADDSRLVTEFFPTGETGHILLTTREHAWGAVARSFAVEKMSEAEGMLFLLRRAKVLPSPESPLAEASSTDQAQAATIVQQMDGLPLALDQAGAYIEETPSTLEAYLKAYHRRQTELLHQRGNAQLAHPTPVATTWSLNFEQVEQASPMAAELLRFLAFLAPDAIPEELIIAGASELGPHLQALAIDDTLLDHPLKVLGRFSLVQRQTDKHLLFIHRLVQAVLKASMSHTTQREWAERAVRAVNLTFPSVSVETWAQCERLLPHALACAELTNHYALALPEAAHLLNQTAYYLDDHAQYPQAKPLYERALAINEQILGPNHPQTAQGLNNLAGLYKSQGDYEHAKPLYERALAIKEQMLGPNHPQTATSLNNLALLYDSQGDYEHATLLYERALAIREQMLGPNHPDTASSLNNLAVLYKSQGDYEHAKPLYERALAIMEKMLGSNHPTIKVVRGNLASLLEEMKQKKQRGC